MYPGLVSNLPQPFSLSLGESPCVLGLWVCDTTPSLLVVFVDLWNPVCEGCSSDQIKTDSKRNFTIFEAVQVLVCVDILSICTILSSLQEFIMNTYILLSIVHTNEQNINLILMELIF